MSLPEIYLDKFLNIEDLMTRLEYSSYSENNAKAIINNKMCSIDKKIEDLKNEIFKNNEKNETRFFIEKIERRFYKILLKIDTCMLPEKSKVYERFFPFMENFFPKKTPLIPLQTAIDIALENIDLEDSNETDYDSDLGETERYDKFMNKRHEKTVQAQQLVQRLFSSEELETSSDTSEELENVDFLDHRFTLKPQNENGEYLTNLIKELPKPSLSQSRLALLLLSWKRKEELRNKDSLSLNINKSNVDFSIKKIFNTSEKLKSLHIQINSSFLEEQTQYILNHLYMLKKLQKLSLTDVYNIRDLNDFPVCLKVKKINFENWSKLTDISNLFKKFPNLKLDENSFINCPNIQKQLAKLKQSQLKFKRKK